MELYQQISKRTGGNIYIGVTGPVRVGKSTFVKALMQKLVIPGIEDPYLRERAIDELPQSGSGKTIMTAEPKFVPEQAVEISPDGTAVLRVRLIDSVGYMVPGVLGVEENGRERMVTTPWAEQEIPLSQAAELGTRKVMEDHCTVGVVITTDGTVTDLERDAYVQAEQRAVADMKATGKPFLLLLNSTAPSKPETMQLAKTLSEQYQVTCLPVDCLHLEREEIGTLLQKLLGEFPMAELAVFLPKWMEALEPDQPLKQLLYQRILETARQIHTMRQADEALQQLKQLEQVDSAGIVSKDLGTGQIQCKIEIPETFFYEILSDRCGIPLRSDADLLQLLTQYAAIRTEYDRISNALEQVRTTGYGIVLPDREEVELKTPELAKKGGVYGIRLRVNAPAIHLMRSDLQAELCPMVGDERQSGQLLQSLLDRYDSGPEELWQSNIFGKSIYEMVTDTLLGKLNQMSDETKNKLRQTLTRIVNQGANGLICLIF